MFAVRRCDTKLSFQNNIFVQSVLTDVCSDTTETWGDFCNNQLNLIMYIIVQEI